MKATCRLFRGDAALLVAALVFTLLGTGGSAWAQSNPTPQSLPYGQDFSGLAHSSTTYPSGLQGWTLSTSPGATFQTGGPTADRALTASSTAATTSGNVHNYNGKIGFLNTGSLDLSIALALVTTGQANISVAYDIMTIRNPYDGGSNTRINEVTLQYRVGTTGTWTSLTGIEYQNNTTTQTTAVTTPQNLVSKSITLPSTCDNQGVVQVRWASRQVSGAGSRPSFAVDNITVTGSAMGACCAPDGSCTLTAESACLSPSVWHAEWTACSPNPCPQPAAACCATDGSCTVTTQAACISPSVWHSEWASCTPNNCALPTGACCNTTTGACSITTQAGCAYTWLGEGVECNETTCPHPIAACCAPNGSCSLTIEPDCASPSVWHPEWIVCEPNNCPQPTAACCATNGSCTVTTEAACVAPSVWHSEWATCSSANCPALKTICEVAADDPVTFRPALEGQYVQVTGLALVRDHQWQAPNIDFEITDGECCVSVFASGTSWPAVAAGDMIQVTGTVGFYSGKTEITTPNLAIIVLSSGNPLPTPADITTSQLATNGEQYDDCMIQIRCVQIVAGGNPWPAAGSNANVWVDDGSGVAILRIDADTDIDGSPEPTGKFTVVGLVTQYDTSSPYTTGYQIVPRSLADLVECTGACCAPDGVCAVTTEAACASPSVWHIEWPLCTPTNPCPQPGACCDPATGGCTLVLESACVAPSVWHPEWIVCEPNNCPQPEGACCVPDTGACTYVTQATCLAPNIWHGEWTCSPNDCPVTPLGACCAVSGACTYIYERDCAAPSVWHDEWTCSPNHCPQPTAACCAPDGSCTLTTEGACAPPSVWHPEWASCSPNNCPVPISTIVDAGPASGVITLAHPNRIIPVRITRTDPTPILGFTVTFTIAGPVTLPAGTGSITLGGFIGASGGLPYFEVTEDGGGVYTADGVTLGSPCGSSALSGVLFNIELTSSALAGTGTVTINSLDLRDCNNASLAAAIGTVGEVLIDRSAPEVTVISPNGGETWYLGEIRDITWSGSDPEGIASYDVAYSVDGGGSYTPIVTALPGTQTSFSWTVTGPTTAAARVRVTAHDIHDNPGSDASDADFTISLYHTITATAYAGGQIVPSGAVPVPHGGNQSFAVTAFLNYHITDVKVDDSSQGPIASYDFLNVTSDHTIDAYFAPNTVTNLDTGLTYATIQGAVDAPETLDGHTIHAAAGNYEEQVVITKEITLDGDGCGATVIMSPLVLTQSFGTSLVSKPIVWVDGKPNVMIQELTVDGADRGNFNYRFVGIAYRNAGGVIRDVCVTRIEDSPFDASSAMGVYTTNDTGGPYAIEMDRVTVTDFQSTGILLGGAGMLYDIHDCEIVGKGPTDVRWQNGIQAGPGPGGSIKRCKVSNLFCTFGSYASTGIFAVSALTPVSISEMNGAYRVTNVQIPIAYQDSDGSIDGAEVFGGAPWGPVQIYNMTSGKREGLGPRVPQLDDDSTAPAKSRSVYAVTVTNSCLVGEHQAGSAGIYAHSEGGGLTVTATNNEIGDWEYGLQPSNVAVLTANYNAVTGNTSAGYDNTYSSISQNAEYNWWGDAGGPGSGGANGIIGDVDYTPWLRSGADANSGCGFLPVTHTITANAGSNGSIDPSGSVIVYDASDQTFTFAPDDCYQVADVVVDGGSLGPMSSYTFYGVTEAHTILVSFSLKTYTISASAGTGGSIDPDGEVVVNCGADKTFSITPSPGYHILDVVVDSVSKGPLASYTFHNVQEIHTIDASFAEDPVKNLDTGLTYLTIQAAIDAVETLDGHHIQVSAGTYAGTVLVDKGVTLLGVQAGVDACTRSGAETVIDGLYNPGGTVQVTAGNVVLDGLKVVHSTYAIFGIAPCTNLTVVNCIVDDASNGIMLYKASTGTVEHNKVSNCSVTGISGGDEENPTTALIDHNCVDHARYGISGYLTGSSIDQNEVTAYAEAPPCGGIAGQFVSTTITGNRVSGYVTGAGVGIGAYPGRPLGSNVSITGNTLSGNGAGIYFDDAQTLVGVVAHYNDIVGSLQHGVANFSAASFDATCNWWGTTAGPGGTNDAFGPVVTMPWLNGSIAGSPTCNLPLSTLTVHIVGSGTVGLVPPGGTYDYGTSVELTAYPAGGWHFVEWTGDATGTANPTTVVMNGDKDVTANFEENPPVAAITDLTATQVRTGNPAGSTTQITLNWTATPPGTTVKVFRTGYGDYPEYDDGTGHVPAAPGGHPPSGEWEEVTAVTAPGQNDLPEARDYHYYVAYVQDGYGTWSPPSNMTTGTLDYHLGDVTPPLGTGDNHVDGIDISGLGAHYGITLVYNDEFNYLDVGPTTNRLTDGRPTTDNQVGFEDLIMFAMNYHEVSFAKAAAPSAGTNELALETPDRVTDGTITARLSLHGTGAILALSAKLTWDPSIVEPIGQSSGDWLTGQGGHLFTPRPGTVDVAVFGSSGIRGDGLLATVTFRVLAAGDPKIAIESADGRSLRNEKVEVNLTLIPQAPAVTALAAARPNPFHRTVSIAFSLAAAGPVDLTIYSVDGRRVRALARDVRDPGQYTLEWDGRDYGGNVVSAGVYYVHLATAQGRFTRAIAYLR